MTQSTAFVCSLPCRNQIEGQETKSSKALRITAIVLSILSIIVGALALSGLIQSIGTGISLGIIGAGACLMLTTSIIRRVAISVPYSPPGSFRLESGGDLNEDPRVIELRQIILETDNIISLNEIWDSLWGDVLADYSDSDSFCSKMGVNTALAAVGIHPYFTVAFEDPQKIPTCIDETSHAPNTNNLIRLAGKTLAYIVKNNPVFHGKQPVEALSTLLDIQLETIAEDAHLPLETVYLKIQNAMDNEAFRNYLDEVQGNIIDIATQELCSSDSEMSAAS